LLLDHDLLVHHENFDYHVVDNYKKHLVQIDHYHNMVERNIHLDGRKNL
jgi:hypothetical protein